MRCFALIFAVFIVLEGFLPCADEFGQEEQIEIVDASDSEDEDANGGDDCSPFCSCACCKVPVANNLGGQSEHGTFLAQELTFQLSLDVSAYHFKIWHPPSA